MFVYELSGCGFESRCSHLASTGFMRFDSSFAENWKVLKEELSFYTIATEFTEKSTQAQDSLLLHCIGPKACEIYNAFAFI